MNLRQAIVFSILMENGEGILDKAPSYVEEKLKSAEALTNPEVMLDLFNLAKLDEWQEKWKVRFKHKE